MEENREIKELERKLIREAYLKNLKEKESTKNSSRKGVKYSLKNDPCLNEPGYFDLFRRNLKRKYDRSDIDNEDNSKRTNIVYVIITNTMDKESGRFVTRNKEEVKKIIGVKDIEFGDTDVSNKSISKYNEINDYNANLLKSIIGDKVDRKESDERLLNRSSSIVPIESTPEVKKPLDSTGNKDHLFKVPLPLTKHLSTSSDSIKKDVTKSDTKLPDESVKNKDILILPHFDVDHVEDGNSKSLINKSYPNSAYTPKLVLPSINTTIKNDKMIYTSPKNMPKLNVSLSDNTNKSTSESPIIDKINIFQPSSTTTPITKSIFPTHTPSISLSYSSNDSSVSIKPLLVTSISPVLPVSNSGINNESSIDSNQSGNLSTKQPFPNIFNKETSTLQLPNILSTTTFSESKSPSSINKTPISTLSSKCTTSESTIVTNIFQNPLFTNKIHIPSPSTKSESTAAPTIFQNSLFANKTTIPSPSTKSDSPTSVTNIFKSPLFTNKTTIPSPSTKSESTGAPTIFQNPLFTSKATIPSPSTKSESTNVTNIFQNPLFTNKATIPSPTTKSESISVTNIFQNSLFTNKTPISVPSPSTKSEPFTITTNIFQNPLSTKTEQSTIATNIFQNSLFTNKTTIPQSSTKSESSTSTNIFQNSLFTNKTTIPSPSTKIESSKGVTNIFPNSLFTNKTPVPIPSPSTKSESSTSTNIFQNSLFTKVPIPTPSSTCITCESTSVTNIFQNPLVINKTPISTNESKNYPTLFSNPISIDKTTTIPSTFANIFNQNTITTSPPSTISNIFQINNTANDSLFKSNDTNLFNISNNSQLTTSNSNQLFQTQTNIFNPFIQSNITNTSKITSSTHGQPTFDIIKTTNNDSIPFNIPNNLFNTTTLSNNNLFNTNPVQNNNLFNTNPVQNNNLFNTNPVQNNNLFNTNPVQNNNLFNTNTLPTNNFFNTTTVSNNNFFNTNTLPNNNLFNNTTSVSNNNIFNTNTVPNNNLFNSTSIQNNNSFNTCVKQNIPFNPIPNFNFSSNLQDNTMQGNMIQKSNITPQQQDIFQQNNTNLQQNNTNLQQQGIFQSNTTPPQTNIFQQSSIFQLQNSNPFNFNSSNIIKPINESHQQQPILQPNDQFTNKKFMRARRTFKR